MSTQFSSLQAGDIIDVIAPGFPSKPEEIRAAVVYLESRGYKARLPENLTAPILFHSNTDENRFLHLQKALLAKDSKAIWCLRGGYGANRLLPGLAKIKKPKHQKILIGISDVTSLHIFLNQKWKWPTLHASLLDRISAGKLPRDLEEELWNILQGKTSKVIHSNLQAMNSVAKKIKKLQGSVIGGNLTVLQSLLATPWQMNLKNSFLAIEDLGERGYRIDRMLEQFSQAGLWKNCAGLLVGEFTGGNEPQMDKSLCMEALQRFARDSKIPVWSGLEIGHGERQRTLWLGASGQISQEKDGSFSLLSSAGAKK